jgi:CubicO group peptidase (beta-lactamase class C family)
MKLRRARLHVLLATVLLTAHCAWQEKSASVDSAFAPDRLLILDAAIQKSIDAGEIPGAVALIAHDGRIVYHRAFGYSDIERQTPMTLDTIFRIASMTKATKAITSVGVMILYERGHFLLSDPLSAYLPEFESPKVLVKADGGGNVLETRDASREITILDLLTHTSGISYPLADNALQPVYKKAGVIDGVTARPFRLEDQMKILARQPLLHDPGEKFTYGLNTDLLGYLCQVISGQPFDEFLAEEIFGPLGMIDTHFYLPEEKAERLATLYAADAEGNLRVSKGDESEIHLDNPRYPVEGARTYFSGGGGLSSTTRDYARFLQMLLNEGELDGARILSRKSVELLTSPGVALEGDGPPKMSAAFYVYGSPGLEGVLTSPGSYGWGGAFYTTYFIDPHENLVAVFMSQGRPVRSSVRDRFGVLVYQALR